MHCRLTGYLIYKSSYLHVKISHSFEKLHFVRRGYLNLSTKMCSQMLVSNRQPFSWDERKINCRSGEKSNCFGGNPANFIDESATVTVTIFGVDNLLPKRVKRKNPVAAAAAAAAAAAERCGFIFEPDVTACTMWTIRALSSAWLLACSADCISVVKDQQTNPTNCLDGHRKFKPNPNKKTMCTAAKYAAGNSHCVTGAV